MTPPTPDSTQPANTSPGMEMLERAMALQGVTQGEWVRDTWDINTSDGEAVADANERSDAQHIALMSPANTATIHAEMTAMAERIAELEAENARLTDVVEIGIRCAQNFVTKVDEGLARSKDSYAKFGLFLRIARAALTPTPETNDAGQ